MNTQDFTTTILVDQTPKEAFDAFNNVRGWWSQEIEGSTSMLNSDFNYHYNDSHLCTIKITEFKPPQKVVWLMTNNYFNFTEDKKELTGTKIIFETRQKDKKTEVTFTHEGLVPNLECFDICSNAWSQYVQQSLYNLITTGKGSPTLKEG